MFCEAPLACSDNVVMKYHWERGDNETKRNRPSLHNGAKIEGSLINCKGTFNSLVIHVTTAEPKSEMASAYTAEEVAAMTDDQLLHEFSRITGKTTLTCKHCHRDCGLEKFVGAIRTRCLKKSSDGLHKDIPLPKTCDVQQARNKASNRVDNYYYPRIRKAATEEEKERLRAELKAARAN